MRLTAAILSLALVAGSGAVLAGGGKGPGGPAHMREALELTDEQVAEMQRIRENGGTREEVQAVLTDEQRAKAREMRKSHDRHGGDKLARLQKKLDLSDEQVAQMREIRKNGGSRKEMNAVLTDEQLAQLDEMRQRHGGKGRGKYEGEGGHGE